MDSMGFAEIEHECEKGHKFVLRQFKGWALIDGKPVEAVVYKDRPACPVCTTMNVETLKVKKPSELEEYPAEVIIAEPEPEHEKSKKKK